MKSHFLYFISLAFLMRKVHGITLCSNSNSNINLCQLNENQTANQPPTPSPLKITPILDIRDILAINEKEETMTLMARIILDWKDLGISVRKAKKRYISI